MPDIIKLSRSTVEKYLSCPRCCVLDKKYQIKPPSLPFTLNIAVDNLCKNEFDYYRKIQEPHPLFIENGIDAVPFKHKDLERWRSNFQGIRYKSIEHKFKKNGFQVAKEAYLLYFNGKKNEELFNNQLNFDVHLIKLDCSTSWVENKIIDTVNLLRSDNFPKPSLDCEYCNYLKKRWQLSIT